MPDLVSTDMNESSSDDAHDDASRGEEPNDVLEQIGRKRQRVQSEEKSIVQPGPTTEPDAPVLQSVATQKGGKRASTRGRSLSMAIKARGGCPTLRLSDSSDDASDTGVHI